MQGMQLRERAISEWQNTCLACCSSHVQSPTSSVKDAEVEGERLPPENCCQPVLDGLV